MFYDRATRLLFVGDPGLNSFDEINVISKGANYGWPFREGTSSGPQVSRTPPGFTSINPIFQFRDPAAVIGGVVYRGSTITRFGWGLHFWRLGERTDPRFAFCRHQPRARTIGRFRT